MSFVIRQILFWPAMLHQASVARARCTYLSAENRRQPLTVKSCYRVQIMVAMLRRIPFGLLHLLRLICLINPVWQLWTSTRQNLAGSAQKRL